MKSDSIRIPKTENVEKVQESWNSSLREFTVGRKDVSHWEDTILTGDISCDRKTGLQRCSNDGTDTSTAIYLVRISIQLGYPQDSER